MAVVPYKIGPKLVEKLTKIPELDTPACDLRCEDSFGSVPLDPFSRSSDPSFPMWPECEIHKSQM